MYSPITLLIFQIRPSMANFNLGNGAPKKRFKDTLKASLKCFDIDLTNWNMQAQQRDCWCSTISNGAKLKRQQRKSRTAAAIPTADSSSSITCSVCHCSFLAKIGLIRHMRTHASISIWCCYDHHLSRWTNYYTAIRSCGAPLKLKLPWSSCAVTLYRVTALLLSSNSTVILQ